MATHHCRIHDEVYPIGMACRYCAAGLPTSHQFEGSAERYNAMVAATDQPGAFPPYSQGSDLRVAECDEEPVDAQAATDAWRLDRIREVVPRDMKKTRCFTESERLIHDILYKYK